MALLPIQIKMLEDIKNKTPHLMSVLLMSAIENDDVDTADYIALHYVDLLSPGLKVLVQLAMPDVLARAANPEPNDPEQDAIIQAKAEALMAGKNHTVH